MSTHEYACVVCGKSTWCTADEHCLGAGRGGCYDRDPKIEFCSLACFNDLRARLEARLTIARELHPEWFLSAP